MTIPTTIFDFPGTGSGYVMVGEGDDETQVGFSPGPAPGTVELWGVRNRPEPTPRQLQAVRRALGLIKLGDWGGSVANRLCNGAEAADRG